MSEVFTKQHVKIDVDLPDKEAYLRYIAKLALKLGIGKEEQGVYEGLLQREKEFSTDLGCGIAIPHTKSDYIARPAVLVLKPQKKLAWGDDKDGEDVQMIISLLSLNEQGGDSHLNLLASLARKLVDEEFKQALLAARNEEEIFRMVEQALLS
ncbi:PTS sugar transporter subunit IIA [Acetonema longum]|uniref:Pts system transporter subunit IIA n=1 Tax=Acetonema longum DSM 6540 TaxID=1009370 RepID=F7NGA2_9FIRM|nr:PTS sugar transporter subunit IIA [Acetonema longum]EGO65020.1 pts system transporter subunit IIA [Acetonema longum DSM 6540]